MPMRLPRVRVTVRWLMVAIAILAVAIAFTFIERRRGFREEARYHAGLAREYESINDGVMEAELSAWIGRKIQHHGSLAVKYEKAAEQPWFGVPPDPPGPGAPPKYSPPEVLRPIESN